MGLQLQIGDAFPRAWLEPLPSLRYVQGLKAHADPPGVAPIFRCNPMYIVESTCINFWNYYVNDIGL